MSKTRSAVGRLTAGCKICHGREAHWSGEDALALALAHHEATGHPTWGKITVNVFYGDEDADVPAPQPGPGHSGGSTTH